MAKPPVRSTTELARHLGLSRWTVSRALNGHAGINRETAERVREAARALSFVPNPFGVGLRQGRVNWVGVGLPDLVDYFLTAKLRRLQEAVRAHGMRVDFEIMDQTEAGEREVIERFVAMRCAAVVLVASRLSAKDPALAALDEAGIRLVRIDPMHPGTAFEVSTDRAHGMRTAVERLHALGHRRFLVAGISAASAYGRQRLVGIRRACEACGIEFEIAGRLGPGTDEDDFAFGARVAGQMPGLRREGFTAVLAINDRVAFGLLRGLAATRLRVPDDVSVIGYDDADFARYSSPPLATIDPRVEELIAAAVGLLTGPAEPARRLKVRPELLERASVAPPRQTSRRA